jgi:hypothetical protein
MGWVIGAAACWAIIAIPAGYVHGRFLRTADRREQGPRQLLRVPDHVPPGLVPARSATAASGRAPLAWALDHAREPTARNHTVAQASYE